MKTKLSTIFLVTGVMFLLAQNPVHAQKSAQTKKNVQPERQGAANMLKEFYMAYIAQYGMDDPQKVQKDLIVIRKKYCTPNLVAKIDKAEKANKLPNDPFTEARSGDLKSLGTLSVVKDPGGQNRYIASYIYSADKSKKTIRLTAVKVGKDSYKINSVGNL